MVERITQLGIYMEEFPVVVIVGPRQVGKTTLARQFAAKAGSQWVFLDMELESDRRKLTDIEAFFELNRDKLIVIDEVQFLPAVFSALRPEVDALRSPGRFLLTGSANPALVKGAAESLAGRVAYLELTPFMLDEVMPDHSLQQHWFRGGYPPALLAKTDAAYHRWMAQYIETFVQRDLDLMFGINLSATLTRNLWQMLANNNGGLLNIEHYARALGATGPTVKKYLQILEGAYLVRSLQPWFVNANKRLVKSTKVYIRDSGLLHELTGIGTPFDLPGNLTVGASWEGYVIEEIARHLPAGLYPYFYRTHHGAEIDLLLVDKTKPVFAIEIKHSKSPTVSDGFYNAVADLQTTRNFIIYTGTDEYPGPGKTIVCGLTAFMQKHLPQYTAGSRD